MVICDAGVLGNLGGTRGSCGTGGNPQAEQEKQHLSGEKLSMFQTSASQLLEVDTVD